MSITHYQDQSNTKTFVNKEVSVNSLSFSGRGKIRSFPRQITIDSEEITFVETGMHSLLQKGQKIVQLFDMSDGLRRRGRRKPPIDGGGKPSREAALV